MTRIAVLCDVVGAHGGAERYWETVLPRLDPRYEVRLFGRRVIDPLAFGVPAQHIAWAEENAQPAGDAASVLDSVLDGCSLTITANVLDPLALQAVRRASRRWIVRLHDHRAFCPNGNKIFPQFSGECHAAMGRACVINSALRGCVCGPRPASLARIRGRLRVREAMQQADAVLVSSGYMRDLSIQNGIAPARIHLTPPPLDDAFLAPPAPQSGRGVLYFGRVTEEKGLHSLVRALGRIPAARRPMLTVAGTGDAESERRARMLAAVLEVDVMWTGWLSQDALREAIDGARVVAFPSLWPEPFGLAGIQALARGRPVVAYDTGGVRDWLDTGGSTVKRGDEAALADAIERYTQDSSLWTAASRAARQRAQSYRLSAHLAQLHTLFDTVATGVAL